MRLKHFLSVFLTLLTLSVGQMWGADESVTFSAQSYSNQQEISSYSGTNFSIAFNKGTNSNPPKYFTSGTAIRAYGGNYFTVSSSTKTITKIELTFGSGDGSNAITTDVNTYSNGTWTGSASSVKFTIGGTSGNRRLAGVAVTYASSKTLSSISVQTAPTKTTYTEGEYFAPAGLVITRTYSDATSDTYTYADHTSEFSFTPSTSTALTTSNTSVTITYGGKSTSQAITVNASGGGGGSGDDVTDVLTASDLAATGTTYVNFSNVTKTSDAIYAGNSALNNSTNIQLRSSNSNSGIVSTKSGGTVKSVKITVASGSNTVDVYGSNTAYTAASDLYGNNKGTKIGSVSSTGTITFTSDYAYVGIRSNSGAVYLSSVEITWEEAEEPECASPASALTITNDNTVTLGNTLTLTSNGGNGGNVTWSVVAGTGTASVSGNTLTPLTKGTVTVTATQEENTVSNVTYCGATPSQQITIVKPAPTPIEGGKVDQITIATTGVESSSYTAFTGKSATNEGHSPAVYAGKIIRGGSVGNYNIQMNTLGADGNAGREIVSTTSGGILKRVEVTWVSTTANRSIKVYGSNTAYTGSETAVVNDDYLGEIAYESGVTSDYVDIEGEHKYVQLVAVGGALNLSQINITWLPVSSAVTISSPTHGTISVKKKSDDSSVSSGTSITAGTVLKVSIADVTGYRFTNLRAYKTGDQSTTVTISNGELTMPDYPITITADETALLAVNIAVNDGDMGSATINGGAGPAYGDDQDEFALVATAKPGYEFVNWTANSENVAYADDDPTAASTTVMVSESVTFTANFQVQACTGLAAPTLDEVTKTYNSATIAWNAVANASSYLLNVTNHATSAKVINNETITAPTVSKELSGLAANTQYDYTVMAVGDGSTYCAESNPLLEDNFTTNDYPTVTFYYSENGTLSAGESKKILTDITLAEPTSDPCEKEFVGWSTVTVDETNVEPAMMQPGDTYQIPTNANCTIYAVYATATPGAPTAVFNEDFASITTGNSTESTGSGSDWTPNDNFSGSASKVYNAGGAIRLGKSGSITTKSLNLSSGAVTVAFKLKGWSSTENTITVQVDDQTTQNATCTGYMSTGDFESKSLTFAAGTSTSVVKFTTGSGTRVFVDDIVISVPGAPTYSAYATTCAAAPTATPSPAALNDVAAAGASGTITMTYDNVNTSGVTVGLFNDEACTEAFSGEWIEVDLDGSKNITYTIAANTSYYDARSAYIKLTAPAEVSGPAAAVVIIPVSQVKKPAVFASLAELAAADLTSGTEVTVTINNRITGIYTNYFDYRYGIYLNQQKYNEEETPVLKDIEIYFKGEQVPASEPEWVIGGTVSGTITCPWEYFTTDEIWELKPGEGWSWSELSYTAPASVTEVSISGTPSKTTYNVGEAFEPAGLTVHVEYSDDTDADITASDDDWAYVTWNIDPATFAAEHIGTGKSVSATATYSGVTSSATNISSLTINAIPVSTVSLNKTAATLREGKTVQLTATIEPSNATFKTVSWESDDTDIATVSETGLVTAVAEGTATITCKSDDDETKYATCAITVVESIDFSAGDWTLVTDVAELTDGSFVIIAAEDYDYAMKSYASGNNCGRESAVKNGNMLTYKNEFAIFEIQNYVEDEVVIGKSLFDVTTEAYLYSASSSSNHMKAKATQDKSTAWEFEISSGTLKAGNLQNTLYEIQYNTDGMFSCYKSTQDPIALYKYFAPVPKVTYNKNTEDEVTGLPAVQKTEWETDAYKATVAAGPSRSGYAFNGWNSAEDGNGDAYTVGVKYSFATDITLYAQWEEIPTYSVTYNTSGSTGTTPVDANAYAEGDEVTLASASGLSNAGYFFDKWVATYVDGNSDIQTLDIEDNKFTMPAFDVTVTATWARKSSDKWIKVTDVSQLVDEKEYIIVNTDATYAIGEQKSNNRAGAAIEENDGIVTISDAVAIFKLGIPETDKYTFYQNGSVADVDKGYLYAASSGSNYMRTQATNDDNGVWTISIGEGGAATITATGENTRNIMRYNPNNGSPVFSCYAYNSSVQNPVTLYYKAPKIDINNGQTVNVSDAEGSDIVIHNGGTLNVDADKSIGDLTVEAGGKVVLDANKLTVVGTFIIESTMASGTSGQLTGATASNFAANGPAYIDITLGAGATGDQWHAFTVPFPVDAINGIFDLDGNKLANEVNYAIMDYHGDIRATGAYGWKKYRQTLVPGTFYLMTVDGERSTYRFMKTADGALVADNTKALYEYASSTGNNDNGWNGVGNPTLMYGTVDQIVQVLNPTSYTYEQFIVGEKNFVVGTPFFVQAGADGTMTMGAVNGEKGNYAPKRAQAKAIENILVRFGNEEYMDKLYISASEDALNQYETGKDLAKMTMTSTPKVAQIFGKAYNTKLCMVYAPLSNDQAVYDLSLYAPQAGMYTIAAPSIENADLYLTKDGAIIWNLSMSACEFELTKGTTEGYGLLLKANAPAIATGVDEVNAEANVQKVVINDNVFILRNGQMYDVTGKAVK